MWFLYDVFYELIELEKVNILMEKGVIEVVFLVYMRGWILNNFFVIFDEV